MDPLNRMRRDFLIIGFTGPLGSGCSEAASFFENDLHKFSKSYIKRYLASTESYIYDIYEKQYKLRSKLNLMQMPLTTDAMHHIDEFNDLLELRHELEQYNQTRRLIRAISQDGATHSFTRIYMTDMLIKIVVQYLIDNKFDCKKNNRAYKKNNKNYKVVQKCIINNGFIRKNAKKIVRVDNSIKLKQFKDQKQQREGLSFYNKYLEIVAELTKKIKQELNDNAGSILQNMGDNIRKNGNPFDDKSKKLGMDKSSLFALSEHANTVIKYFRDTSRISGKQKSEKPDLFVIESFRNPAEVQFFRSRYYEFYLFSIYATKELRLQRCLDKGDKLNDERDTRDSGERNQINELYKQNVSSCVRMSDIAINNEYYGKNNKDKNNAKNNFYSKLLHYYALIRMPGCRKPNTDEEFMTQAYTLSLRSSCISRQVGAVITKDGSIIGGGWNDVAKNQVGCGDMVRKDYEQIMSNAMPFVPVKEVDDVVKIILEGDDERAFCFKDVYTKYKENKLNIKEYKSAIKGLQYCRALHAEENAIIQVSKLGGISIINATLYTTSFPCELCAKKIYQAGISRVVYTEPYPSVSEVIINSGFRFIKLDQFEGVKPHSFYRLFKSYMDDKDLQELEKTN
jgi:deoxycytidylate deaminase